MNRADFSDERQKAEQKLADEVTADFERRREERKRLERAWELNMNFVCGNQYCGINSVGEIEEEESITAGNRAAFSTELLLRWN